jgi:hypothetical protein
VPVTHDATRIVAMIEWGLCGLFAALLLRRSTGDSIFSAAGGLLVFLFLEPVTKEPSHPQLLALLLLLGAAWVWTHPNARWKGAAIVGLLVGALFAVKPNLGLFAVLGLALGLSRSMGGRMIPAALGLGAMALPVLLLRPGFREPTVAAYACLCGLAALAYALDRRRPPGPDAETWRTLGPQAGMLLAGAAVAVVGASVFAWGRGTTLGGLLDGVLLRPMNFAGAVVGPKPFSWFMVIPAFAAVLVAVGINRAGWARTVATPGRDVLGIGVLGVVSIGYLLTACSPLEEGGQTRAFGGILLGLGTPWVFLLRRPRIEGESAGPGGKVQETLIALSVTHLAIGFPSAGTQLSCAASLLVLAALAAAHEGLGRRLSVVATRRAILAAVLVAVIVPAGAASTTYRSSRSLALPGARWLRVDPDVAVQLQAATEVLRANGGPFVSVYGMNSLYLWTRMPPPTPANATLWPIMLNEAEQTAIIAALERDERSVVLVATGEPYLRDEAKEHVLGRWIRDRTAPWLEVGPAQWQIRRRRGF